MAPGIAVALWIHDARVFSVDEAVAVLIRDVVSLSIGHFALVLGEVPEQTVVNRRGPHGGRAVIASAQQHQLLFEQRVELVLEGEDGRRQRAVTGGVGAEPNGRIGGVGKRFVAEQHVEVGDATGRQQQRIIGRGVVDRRHGLDTEPSGPAQDGFVGLNQTDAVQVGGAGIEGDVAFVTRPRLLQHAGERDRLRFVERLGPRLERIQTKDHAFHPAFGKLRLAAADGPDPIAPVGLAANGVTAIAADEPVVGEREQTR